MSNVQLRDSFGMCPGTLGKLSKSQRVSLEVLEKICNQLDCNLWDTINYVEDQKNNEGSNNKW